MKKQYWISTHGFKSVIRLYHDGKMIHENSVWIDDAERLTNELKRQGYQRGYLPDEVEEVRQKYLAMIPYEIWTVD